ncbi:MAG TPA: sugar phosphate isomerase/epimerase family protein [Terracidiphilus sp.]|jgi:sugar phosphate isomerase/epimerase|nr:sugar phosphate isomerase/epimerase family protein [Terracidiphilus sp.]
MSSSRREFIAGLGAAGVLTAVPRMAQASTTCPFRLSVINDEISPDFDHACSVAANDFGLQWIELRSMWRKNVTDLNDDEVEKSRQILEKHNLRVTDIASPLFKVNWPGAPQSKEAPKRDEFHADFDFKQQDKVLARCIELCKVFKTDRIRCFDFWRLEDPKPYRAAMNDKLREAARTCAKHDLILLLENEMACNTGSGKEAAAVLHEIREPNFMLNWDPGNSATFAGDVPYPDDYNMLPKHRIGHCHCKDTIRKPDGKFEWAPVGGGIVDWVGQFKAFERDGYHYAVSLETHWHGGKPPAGSDMSVGEASSRISMKGLKEALKKAGANC